MPAHCWHRLVLSSEASGSIINSINNSIKLRRHSMKSIKVGLLGIGTVGAGTFNVLKRNQEEIARRAGRGIEIVMVADLDAARAKEVTGGTCEVVSDGNLVVSNPDIDVVI